MTTPNDAFEHDALLTAYVLGELDSTETERLEARLEVEPELRAEVDAIRATTDSLHAALSAETGPGLTDDQRAAITRAGSGTNADAPDAPEAQADPPAPLIFASRRFWAGIGLAAAACIVIALWLPSMLRPDEGENFARGERTTLGDALSRDDASSPEPAAAPGRGRSTPALGKKDDEDKREAETPREYVLADRAPVDSGDAGVSLRAEQAKASASSMEELTRNTIGHSGAARELNGAASGGGGKVVLRDNAVPGARRRRVVQTPAAAGVSEPPRGDAMYRAGPPSEAARAMKERRAAGRIDADIAGRAIDRKHGYLSTSGVVIGGGESYQQLVDNPFRSPLDAPLSTLSTDVDTASYANVRRFLNQGSIPPKDAVRIEELINYFDYDYAQPDGEHPFAVALAMTECPWAPDHRLVRIGLQAQTIEVEERPAANLVFLLDVSGSMNQPNKLPLVKESMKMLLEQLTGEDRVAIVTYAGQSGLALESTYCSEKAVIANAIDSLRAGGSTAGAAGIVLAYEQAVSHLIEGGVNRVVLCTDGDFNVGMSSDAEMVSLIEKKRDDGVYLTVLGFGTGNWQDAKMEQLSNAGNGNFAYIDSRPEAKKVLVDELSGTLVTVAKDVKYQVEFNPARVGAYRLIGYANRLLAPEDFNDDTKDAGDVGAGHSVTVLYEVVPPDIVAKRRSVDPLKYQQAQKAAPSIDVVDSPELLTVKLRYKSPEGGASQLLEIPLVDEGVELAGMSGDEQFAAAVAAFGMILRDSEYRGNTDFGLVLDLAATGLGDVPDERRTEFIALVERARGIMGEVEHRPAARFDGPTTGPIEATEQASPE